MTKLSDRFIAALIAIVVSLYFVNLIFTPDNQAFLRAAAAAKDYAVGFKWDISELIADGQADDGTTHPADPSRIVELTNGGKDLKLTELVSENPVLKTTFSFNLRKAIEPGNLTFTIEGMDSLIRDGVIDMGMNDPNLVKTWDIQKVPGEDKYTFTNKVKVTSNNETTFTWQFKSRDAINQYDIDLKTSCVVTEVEMENGEPTGNTQQVELNTNPIHFHYESVKDENEVKIVCQKIEDLDANNMNTDYDWRGYYSMIGLEGLTEWMNNPNDPNEPDPQPDPADPDMNAHYITQDQDEQDTNRNARGIRKADHFIALNVPEELRSSIMIVDKNGSHVSLAEYTINTPDGPQTLYGFYDFKGKSDIDLKSGESYSSIYRVGVLNSILSETPLRIELQDYFIPTYNDESTPVVLTDKAAHEVSKEDIQHIGEGDWLEKHNKYEIYNSHKYNGVIYDIHAKHYSPQNQLLYDTIFNGKVVTYHLDATTNQAKIKNGELEEALWYDLIFEDAAPWIENLSEKPDRVLGFDEYDFVRVKVEKLVDGNTVTGQTENLHGFDFDLYGRHEDGAFYRIGGGNTIAPTEIFLPEGIDEIKIVIRDLAIRTKVDVSVDIRYNVHEEDMDAVYIDNSSEHDTVTENGKKYRHENTNTGTRLKNTFNRKQYVRASNAPEDAYNYELADTYTYRLNDSKHSNTWLRDSTTVIDSSAKIERFAFHDALSELEAAGEEPPAGFSPSDYYTTTISAGGTVKSDSEKGMNHFIVCSKLPDHVTPSAGWQQAVRESFEFSAVLQGTGELITKEDVFAENAVSFYYDEATNSICAEFNFDSFALKMDDLTSCNFSYPAEITLAQVKALNEAVHNFTATTYVTVLDDNVKLSATENKTLLTAGNNPYGFDKQMSKATDTVTLNAMGSQKSNECVKHVKSYYNDWVFDNSVTVDGNNTDYLDQGTNRMTSEYTYQMAFHRLTSDSEHVIDPLMLDIVEDCEDANWLGEVRSVSFDADSYPDGSYVPEVYYLMRNDVTDNQNISDPFDYRHTNETIRTAVENFQKYGETSAGGDDELTQEQIDQYNLDLGYYNTLKNKIMNLEDGWKKATQSGSEWLIGKENVYAVAILFKGDYVVPDQYLKLTADLNMRAPEIVNSSEIEHVINNRATYNDTHVFAQGEDNLGVEFPMYSVSNRTMVILNHSVELEKVSSKSGKRLTGAQFTVYNSGTCQETDIVKYFDFNKRLAQNVQKSMKDMEVDLSGILRLDLAPGIFYYKETKAPLGYELDDGAYRFRVISDDNAVYYYSVGLKTPEELAREYLIVNNVEYNDYPDIYGSKTPVDSSQVFHVYDPDGEPVDHLRYDNERGAYVYDPEEGNEDSFTFSSGSVTLSDLPAGSYYVAAAKNDTDAYSFSVADKSSISLRAFRKSPQTSGVSYHVYKKVGEEISANDILCRFTGDNGNYTLSSNSDDKTTISPNGSGVLNVTGLDDQSSYYLLFEDVPEFFKNTHLPVFEIQNETGFSRIAAEELVKTGRIVVEDEPIEQASAKFQKVDGVDGKTLVSDAVYSIYYVESDGSESKLYFSYDATKQTYIYSGLTGSSGLTSELQSQKIGDKAGQILVDNIGYGVYYLQEVKAPTGFLLDTDKHYFRVSASTIDGNRQLRFGTAGGEGEGQTDTLDILSLYDDEVLSNIELNKTEEVNPENYLGYATYYVFRLNDDVQLAHAKEIADNARGNTTSTDFTACWTLVRTVETDISGQASIRDLPFGTYLLYEAKPPKGYKWNNDSALWETWTEMDTKHEQNNQIIVLSAETLAANSTTRLNDDGEEEVVYHTFYAMHRDERKEGEARLLKKNANNLGLTDGNFTLYRVEFTTAEENAALISHFGLTQAEINVLTAAERKDWLSKLSLTQDDVILSDHFEDGKPKAGVDTVIKQGLKTSFDPALGATETVSGLDWGVYYFYEVKAPSGYQQDTTPQFFVVDVNNVGSTIEVNMTNDKTYGKIWLYKQAKEAVNDEHTKLFGAQFNLYTKTNEQVASVPMLRVGGLTGAVSTKEFLVTGFTVIDKSHIEFQLENGYAVTLSYEESNRGRVVGVSGNSAFEADYGNSLDPNDARLTYYAVSKDRSQVYDDAMKKYRDITQEELSCVTLTYVTADEGGRFVVRGLEWDSYYFHETVPPEGYGLADDVVFTVNAYNCDNQFLKCEDPKAQAAIIIDKEIPDASYFAAYGDPTFLFRIYGLKETEAGETVDYTKGTQNYTKDGREYTLAVHLSDPNTFGTAMTNVDVGQYLIEELPVSRYSCVDLEMVTGSGTVKVKSAGTNTPTSTLVSGDNDKYDINGSSANAPWTAFCDLSGGDSTFGEMVTFHVKYTNDIERYDSFSHVSFADNQLPGQEYITAFKPLYKPLVQVEGHTNNTYEIDLKAALLAGNDDFEAVLSYNTEKQKKFEAEDLSRIRFSTALKSPITAVSYDPSTGKLYVTVEDPDALAGQSISIDVGYSEDPNFNAYDIEDTSMVSGELALTFSERKADVRKRVVLRNDVTNKTYFPYANTDNKLQDVTSVALIYKKDADDGTVTKTMENDAYTSNLKVNDPENYDMSGWYLLDSDGRPMLDSNQDLVLFKNEEELQAFIFNGTYPNYVTDALKTEKMRDMAEHIDLLNSFTFQAQVEKITVRPLKARVIMVANTPAFSNNGIWNSNNPCVTGSLSSVNATNITAFKEGNADGWELAAENDRLTYDSYAGNYTEGSPYPDLIRFYAIGTEVFWYTVDRDTQEPSKGSVYAEFHSVDYRNTPKLFNKYSTLEDVSGMYDWDLSGMTMTGYMFEGTHITEFKLNRTYKSSDYMYMSRMFFDCQYLTTVTMDIDTSAAPYVNYYAPNSDKTYQSAQAKQMFSNCIALEHLNLSGDFSNIYNVENMFQNCTAITAQEFKKAFATWSWNKDNAWQNNNIFKNNSNLANALNGVDLVDANGNHYKRKGDYLEYNANP
ncbi:MAG: hypothetical protein K5695_11810 [Oscillospiraceae bacterium]|nr:hypothetical protein [Oscillospiraceae bacterium]